MKKFGLAVLITLLIFIISISLLVPMIMNIGYSSVDGSYHAATHAILLSLICTVIFCTMLILDEIKKVKHNNSSKER